MQSIKIFTSYVIVTRDTLAAPYLNIFSLSLSLFCSSPSIDFGCHLLQRKLPPPFPTDTTVEKFATVAFVCQALYIMATETGDADLIRQFEEMKVSDKNWKFKHVVVKNPLSERMMVSQSIDASDQGMF